MKNLFQIVTDTAEQQRKIDEEDVLCLLLRQNLGPVQTIALVNKFTVFPFDYEGHRHFGVAFGFMSEEMLMQPDPKSEAFIDEMWGEREYVSDEESHIFERFLEDACCLLLHETLTPMQMMFLKYTYHIIDIDYEGHPRHAVACAIYNSKNNTTLEPAIIHQPFAVEGGLCPPKG